MHSPISATAAKSAVKNLICGSSQCASLDSAQTGTYEVSAALLNRDLHGYAHIALCQENLIFVQTARLSLLLSGTVECGLLF